MQKHKQYNEVKYTKKTNSGYVLVNWKRYVLKFKTQMNRICGNCLVACSMGLKQPLKMCGPHDRNDSGSIIRRAVCIE